MSHSRVGIDSRLTIAAILTDSLFLTVFGAGRSFSLRPFAEVVFITRERILIRRIDVPHKIECVIYIDHAVAVQIARLIDGIFARQQYMAKQVRRIIFIHLGVVIHISDDNGLCIQ